MLRRVGIAFALLLAVLVVGIPGWIALHRDDLPAVDDADLEAPPFEGTPEDDGWPAFREAAEAVVWPEEDGSYERLIAMHRGEAWDPQWLRARLRANEPAFQALEEALASSHTQIPTFDAHDDGSWDALSTNRMLTRMATVRAQLLLRRGERGAFESGLLGMRVGHEISEAHGLNLVSIALAMSHQSISLSGIEFLLREPVVSGETAAELAKQLEDNRWAGDAWARAWTSEYHFMRATLRGAVEAYRENPGAMGATDSEDSVPFYRSTRNLLQFLPPDYVFHENRTLHELAGIYRRLGQRSTLDCRAASEIPAVPAAPSPWRAGATLLLPNAAGRLVIGLGIPSYALFDAKRCHVETRISLVQALAALTAYRGDHDVLPERLDALVPDYLPAVPEDRFSGEPLRWSRERGVVWSVGEDLVDDGPPAEPSQGDASAPAISVAPVQARSAVLPMSSRARS